MFLRFSLLVILGNFLFYIPLSFANGQHPVVTHQPASGVQWDSPGVKVTGDKNSTTYTKTDNTESKSADGKQTVTTETTKSLTVNHKDGTKTDKVESKQTTKDSASTKDGGTYTKTSTIIRENTTRDTKDGKTTTKTTIQKTRLHHSEPNQDGQTTITKSELKSSMTKTTDPDGTESTEWKDSDGGSHVYTKYGDGSGYQTEHQTRDGKYSHTETFNKDGSWIKYTSQDGGSLTETKRTDGTRTTSELFKDGRQKWEDFDKDDHLTRKTLVKKDGKTTKIIHYDKDGNETIIDYYDGHTKVKTVDKTKKKSDEDTFGDETFPDGLHGKPVLSRDISFESGETRLEHNYRDY